MSVSNLAIVLISLFSVSIFALAGELFYVLYRRRTFHRHSSPPPPIDETLEISTVDPATKELLYFFCLKPHAQVELEHDPSKESNKASSNGSSQGDQVVDVFKLLERNGPSRFLSMIREENEDADDEDLESTPDVDFSKESSKEDGDFLNESSMENGGLESCVELEKVVVIVDGDDGAAKTGFSTPCDSPYFIPMASPSHEYIESEYVVDKRGIETVIKDYKRK